MRIFIGHNGHSALSRLFVERYQNQPEVEDVLDYLHEVGPFTNYRGFPFVGVIMDNGAQHNLYNPANWEEVTVWIATLGQIQPASRTMTKYVFRTRVLTFAERMTMDNSTVPELVTMRNDLSLAEVVDLDEVAKYRPVMLATGLATEARIDEIIAGVTHA